jgi:hypothetical protein
MAVSERCSLSLTCHVVREWFFVFRRHRCGISVPDLTPNCFWEERYHQVPGPAYDVAALSTVSYSVKICMYLRLRALHTRSGGNEGGPNAAHAIGRMAPIPIPRVQVILFSYASAL